MPDHDRLHAGAYNRTDAVLNGYIMLTHYPATLSKNIIADLLRNTIYYDGVVITDVLNMATIYDNQRYKKAIEFAFQAEVDAILQFIAEHYQDMTGDITFEIIFSITVRMKISEENSFRRFMTYKLKPANNGNY